MKILVVAMADSIHTARWLSQLTDQGWEIHLFPSTDYGIVHPEMRNLTVHHSIYGQRKNNDKSIKFKGLYTFSKHIAEFGRSSLRILVKNYRIIQLQWLIKKIKPDVIHSLEIQHAGYLTLAAKKKIKKGYFPPWIVTNWGSDIYLFGRLTEHEPKIKEVLSLADYYSCECYRDVELARLFGFKGHILPVFPNTGGIDLELIPHLRSSGLVSNRRIIMLKGYQTWAGRALVGLRALERCAELLGDYQIAIFSASSDVLIAAELFSKATGISTIIIPKETSHYEILKWHGRSRVSIGLSISDAISTSLLEAMAMGSFPIQSCTACANEWIEDGKTGLLVPPEDVDLIETALRKVLTDDDLVNRAAEQNYIVIKEKLDCFELKKKAIKIYEFVSKKK